MKDWISLYMITMKTYFMYGCYALMIAIMALYCVGACFQSPWLLYVMVSFSELFVVFMSLFCSILMIIVTFWADFCMAPGKNMANIAPTKDLENIVSYFAFCTGTNPFSAPVGDAQSAISTITAAIYQVAGACYPVYPSEYPSWMTTSNESVAMNNAMGSIKATVDDCPPIQNSWSKMVDQGMCTHIFSGVYAFWIAEYTMSGCLFFTIIMATVVWQYFGTAWHLKKTGLPVKDSDGPVVYHGADDDDYSLEDDGTGAYNDEYVFTAAQPHTPTVHGVTKEEADLI
jgi:hypothetical protein